MNHFESFIFLFQSLLKGWNLVELVKHFFNKDTEQSNLKSLVDLFIFIHAKVGMSYIFYDQILSCPLKGHFRPRILLKTSIQDMEHRYVIFNNMLWGRSEKDKGLSPSEGV